MEDCDYYLRTRSLIEGGVLSNARITVIDKSDLRKFTTEFFNLARWLGVAKTTQMHQIIDICVSHLVKDKVSRQSYPLPFMFGDHTLWKHKICQGSPTNGACDTTSSVMYNK